jgi:hypothetical protein
MFSFQNFKLELQDTLIYIKQSLAFSEIASCVSTAHTSMQGTRKSIKLYGYVRVLAAHNTLERL